jgi:hypothetical protein
VIEGQTDSTCHPSVELTLSPVHPNRQKVAQPTDTGPPLLLLARCLHPELAVERTFSVTGEVYTFPFRANPMR